MMRTAVVLALLVAAVATFPAVAAGPPPGLKATISGTTVTIHNGSTQTFTFFEVNSTDNPVITGASGASCKPGKGPWSSNGKKHVDYWVDCTTALKPGKTLVLKLTLTGSGSMKVWVKIGGTEFQIGGPKG